MADRAQFSEQVLAHARQLYAHALRSTGNRADAEDLLQETYLRAWRGYDGFVEGTNLRAWLFKIMTNQYINQYNKDAKTPDFEPLDDIEDFFLYRRLAGNGSSGSAASAESTLLASLTDDEVLAALDALNPDQRQVVLLRDVEGFKYGEIAEMLDIAPGTVMSRLYRGRQNLEMALHAFAVEAGLVSA